MGAVLQFTVNTIKPRSFRNGTNEYGDGMPVLIIRFFNSLLRQILESNAVSLVTNSKLNCRWQYLFPYLSGIFSSECAQNELWPRKQN